MRQCLEAKNQNLKKNEAMAELRHKQEQITLRLNSKLVQGAETQSLGMPR